MQVSHVETANTHAIMGGGKARAFGMSQSAEFFTVLSDTLYRDKKRAVIRETVCNAWDAHIATGKTSIPVEITLNDKELIIKDFGPGIPDDMIVINYCVYGNSTKKKDENQTGGFGLGSKAPFAYSDHFSVTSCHKGIKNIYAISRGGIETKGIPDLRTMVSVPTEETGLTVSIPVKSVEDMKEFMRIIARVVHQGGMKVKVNDKELPTTDYSEARKTGYMVVKSSERDLNESSVYLLYGTVLYPVSSTEEKIFNIVQKLKAASPGEYKVILVAPPNSIGVTPSRESLSYTDSTIATIIMLGKRMIRQVGAHREEARNIFANKMIAAVDEEWRYQLFRFGAGEFTISDLLKTGDYDGGNLSNPLDIAHIIAAQSFQNDGDSRRNIKVISRAAARRWSKDRRSLRRMFDFKVDDNWNEKKSFITREATRAGTKLIIRAALRADALKTLYVTMGRRRDNTTRTLNLDNLELHNAPSKIIVIAQNRAEAAIYIKHVMAGAEKRSRYEVPFFCASIPRSKKALRESLAKEARKLGFNVHCVENPLPKKPKIEKPKNTFLDIENFGNTHGFGAIPTLTNPEYYVNVDATVANLRNRFAWFEKLRDFLKDEGFEKIAVVRSEAQCRKIEREGAKDVIMVLLERIKKKSKLREGRIARLIMSGDPWVESKDSTYKFSEVRTITDIIAAHPMTFFEFARIRGVNKEAIVRTSRMLHVVYGYMENSSDVKTKNSKYFGADFFSRLHSEALWNEGAILPSKSEVLARYHDVSVINTWGISGCDTETVLRVLRAIRRNNIKGESK